MNSIHDIKKKIGTIEVVIKTTKAMKLVATATLKKTMSKFNKQKQYFAHFYELFSAVQKELPSSALNQKANKNPNTLWIIFGSSLGLCGGFNLNNVKLLKNEIKQGDLICVFGRKIKSILKNKGIENKIIWEFESDEKTLDQAFFSAFAKELFDLYLEQIHFGKIKIIYTKFVNSLVLQPEKFNLYPIDKSEFENKVLSETTSKSLSKYEFNPTPAILFEKLIYLYIETIALGAFLETKTSENAARKNAMETANKNGDELIESYKIEFNKKRQAKITQEITELVASVDIGE